jgi:cold shock CspA family protein
MTEESNTPPSYGSEIGNVLWFDQKKGFGFIKIMTPSSEFLDREVFVHYSNINSVNTFKKLYPGENVSLNVVKNTEENNGKEYICQNVSGLLGSQLLVDNENYLIKVIKKRQSASNEGQ